MTLLCEASVGRGLVAVLDHGLLSRQRLLALLGEEALPGL